MPFEERILAATRLKPRRVNKVWGRHSLWAGFEDALPLEPPIGEIWFEDPRGGDHELLVKYLFTSQRLSVQVHPDAQLARSLGGRRGKDEAWIVLAADPGAMIGIGLTTALAQDELRAAALDGSIEALLDWRSVDVGDVYYSPAGTIHAIGAGVTLIEIQENCDTTYRLYDYGRSRELHVDEALDASYPARHVARSVPVELSASRRLLCDGPAFCVERWNGSATYELSSTSGPVWLVPLSGTIIADGEALFAGETWLLENGSRLSLHDGADLVLAYKSPVMTVLPNSV